MGQWTVHFLISSNGHSGNPGTGTLLFSFLVRALQSAKYNEKNCGLCFTSLVFLTKTGREACEHLCPEWWDRYCCVGPRVLHSTVTAWNSLAEGMNFSIPSCSGCCSDYPETKVQFCSAEKLFLLNKLICQRRAQIVVLRDYWRILFIICKHKIG